MKSFLFAFFPALLFLSCQKKVTNPASEDQFNGATTASNVLLPLPCHSINFITDNPIKAGEVPPFRFTKTLWPDTRVKTINMLSRRFPIYPGYQKHAVELTGKFTYATNQATFKGNSVIWEYYRAANGSAGKRQLSNRPIHWFFAINQYGYCDYVEDRNLVGPGGESPLDYRSLDIYYDPFNPQKIKTISVLRYRENFNESAYFYPNHDQYGNIVSFNLPDHPTHSSTTYAYDYTIPRGTKNYSFIPSQNLISEEYNLLEVMQWLPQSTHQRKAVAGVFFLPNGTKVTQSQIYKNYQFDAQGNQTSVTYGDNVPQRTTWYCK